MIKLSLEGKAVPNPTGGAKWDISQIRSILGNEKYCGDVLMQKTFTQDCINKKVIKNTGQLPMYLIQNNHPAIVSREIYQAVQAEKTRRSASASPSKRTSSTGRSCYASKFALSERLVCGECGTLYRRCTWKRNGKTRIVWRCVSRLDYLFCNQYGEMLSENALRLAIAHYNRSRGVGKTSIHLFRHTFARKYLVDCGGDAFMLQKLLGHSTLAMTKHYCAIYDADISKNYDRFSPLAQLQQTKSKLRRA